MALKISDRVKETTVTTGTGTVTLAGAVTGFRTFGSVLSINDTTYYAIVSSSEFEVGIGTFTSSTTLTRDTVLSSSNSNLKVDFGAGSKNVFITQPADKAIYQDASGNVAGLNTDNVTEGSTNLYFTDERVDDRVGSLLVAGDNVTLSYDDAAGTLTISATEDNLSNNTTDDLAEGSTNLYYTSARANADFDTRLATKDTDDLSEGLTNLYYTNERVDDRVSNLLQDGTGISFAYDDSNNVLTPTVTLSPFSTTNLSEGTNLYFTNERVDDRVANLLTAGSNITLTYDDTAGTLTIAGIEDDLSNNDTDDLSEGATNLYFTNERVDDRVSALVQNGTGISWSYNDVSGTLTPTISLSAFSTSDLSEGTNLYYTTARFDSAFSGKSTSDLSEGTNLYYTTARFDTAFSGKTTDNLTEGSTNLYYTDTRANAAIDARVTQSFVNALNVTAAGVQANSVALGTDTTGNYIATIAGTANKITVTGSGSESAAVTLTLPDDVQIANDLTVAGDLTVNGATTTLGTTNLEVSDNLFELNAGLTTAPVNDSGMLIQRGTSDNAIFMWDESADKFTLGTTTSDATVTGNIVITTGSLVANLEGNVTGNVTGTVSSLSNHDTGDLAEGTNLYYTDARSRAAISASGDISYDSSTGVISFTQATAPVTSVNTLTGAVVLDTDDISEGVSNLYYTAARFNSAFAAKSTSDLSEGTNLYLTQERVEDYVGGMVSGNTETGIAVTYDDTNGKLNFVIDTLNQDTTGNAATATALETARNFSLTGDVTASAVSFDGSANVALSTSIAANTVGITELNVTDGTNGQVLTTDGAGSLSFSSISGYSDSDVESYLDGGTSTPTFASATVSGDFTVDTSTLKVDSTNNRVGIGTASPDQLLHISAAADTAIRIENTDTTATSGQTIGKIEFEGQDASTNASGVRALIDAQYAGVGGQGRLKFQLAQENSASLSDSLLLNYGTQQFFTSGSEAMRIDSSGNVGIGTASPAHLLHLSAADPRIQLTDTNTNVDHIINANSSVGNLTIDVDANAEGSSPNLIIDVAGAERMRINSSGNVGIGTASPSHPLHVSSASGAAQAFFNTTSGNTNFQIKITEDDGTVLISKDNTAARNLSFQIGDNEAMRITSGREILFGKTAEDNTTQGIRIDAPFGLLSASRDGNLPLLVNRNTSDGTVIDIRKDGTSAGTLAARIGDLVIGNNDVGLRFSDGGDSILPAQSGSTGDRDNAIDLGASGARFKDAYLGGSLYADGNTTDFEGIRVLNTNSAASPTTSSILMGITNTVRSVYTKIETEEIGNDSNGTDLVFYTTPAATATLTEQMRLTDSGSVLVGTTGTGTQSARMFVETSGACPLEIETDSANGGYLAISQNNAAKAFLGCGSNIGTSSVNDVALRSQSGALAFQTNGANERMRIDSSGNLLVGTTTFSSPPDGFTVSSSNETKIQIAHANGTGSGVAFASFLYNAGVIGSITQFGTTATNYNTSSDYRLKENVVYDWTALDRLNQLKPARFNFIASADTTVDGFLAHEVQDIVPEAISGEKDAVDDEDNPIYQGIDQSKLVPLLTKAVQELSAKVEALEAQLQGN